MENEDLQSLNAWLAGVQAMPDFAHITQFDARVKGGFGDTLLHLAVVQNDAEIATLLLKHGADVNASGEHGYTPLHEAVEQGFIEMVELLLQKGASTSIANDDGQTARDLAALSGNAELVRRIG